MRHAIPMLSMLALSACNKAPSSGESLPSGDSTVIVADGNGFTPSQVTLKKGGPGKLKFERKAEETCATDVVFADLNIKQPLPLNQVVEVTVPTNEAKTYAFTCGMGMYKSAVVVQ